MAQVHVYLAVVQTLVIEAVILKNPDFEAGAGQHVHARGNGIIEHQLPVQAAVVTGFVQLVVEAVEQGPADVHVAGAAAQGQVGRERIRHRRRHLVPAVAQLQLAHFIEEIRLLLVADAPVHAARDVGVGELNVTAAKIEQAENTGFDALILKHVRQIGLPHQPDTQQRVHGQRRNDVVNHKARVVAIRAGGRRGHARRRVAGQGAGAGRAAVRHHLVLVVLKLILARVHGLVGPATLPAAQAFAGPAGGRVGGGRGLSGRGRRGHGHRPVFQGLLTSGFAQQQPGGRLERGQQEQLVVALAARHERQDAGRGVVVGVLQVAHEARQRVVLPGFEVVAV